MGVDFLLRNAKKLLIFAAFITLITALIATFLNYIGTQVSAVLSANGLSFIPIFAPSNFATCIGIVVAVKLASTIYETGLQLLKWKVDILA